MFQRAGDRGWATESPAQFFACEPGHRPYRGEPGDVLRVHIRAIRPEKTGALMTAPGAGALPDRVKGDTRICPIADGHFTFMGVELPLNPMIGVIGVAPAGESVPCGTPGDHGGNMDRHP